MTYKLTTAFGIVRLRDLASIPCNYVGGVVVPTDPYSPAVREFTDWIALGNVPMPADPIPAPVDQNDFNNLTKAFRAKCISDLSFRLNVAPGALTLAQIQAERTRIKSIADAF